MKINISNAYIASQIGCNFLAILALFGSISLIDSIQIAEMLIALSLVNFYQGFVGTFISEVFTTKFLKEKSSLHSDYVLASVLFSLIFSLIIFAISFFGLLEIQDKYLLLITVSVFFGAPFYINRADLLLNGKLSNLTIINIFDCILYIYVVLSILIIPNFILTYDMLLLRIPIIAIYQLRFINLNLGSSLNSLLKIPKNFFERYKELKLALNLLLKSGVNNLDIIVLAYAVGKDFVPIYKLLQSMKTLLMSFSGTYWKSKIASSINESKLNVKNLKNVIKNIFFITIFFACVGSIFIIVGIDIINLYPDTFKEIKAEFWLYKTEILLYLSLVAVPYAISQWTRVVLLLADNIIFSSYCYFLISISILIASLASTSFISFIITIGVGTFVIVFSYNIFIFSYVRKKYMRMH